MTNRNTQQRCSVQAGIREPGPGHLPKFFGCYVTVVALVRLVRSLGRVPTQGGLLSNPVMPVPSSRGAR